MKRIALYHIETLLWIARLGTFGAAAKRLNTTQPAISARVRELEAQLGMQIFRREGRAMALTVRGRQLVQDCEPLWSEIERALLNADGPAGMTGVVRVGAGEIAAASCLPGFVAQVQQALPAIGLEITIDLTANLLQQLLGSTADIVFLAGPVATPGIRTTAIGSVRLIWAASPATARGMAAADPGVAWPSIWSLPRHSPLHQVTADTISDRPGRPTALNTCNNVRLMIDIVAEGRGIALFPETMVRGHLADGSLVEVFESPARAILFQAAIRSTERDPVVLDIFRRADRLSINPSASDGSR